MKILIVICLVLLISNIYLILDNRSLNSQILRQEEANTALTIYLETLQDKLRDYQTERTEGIEIPKTTKIRELMESYLRDREDYQIRPESLITTDELRNDLQEYQMKQRFIPNLIPVINEYAVSRKFTEKHKGVDLAASLGSEVIATGAGVIKSVYEDKYFGNVVVIDHLNHYITFYAHLAKSFHQPGFFVEKGQTIGLIGSSGFSKSPHLHYEILYQGENIDPLTRANYQF